jgi:hypothetical protein
MSIMSEVFCTGRVARIVGGERAGAREVILCKLRTEVGVA